MKRERIITFAILIISLILISNMSATAQSDFKIGGGLGYGTEAESIGIKAGGLYGFSDKFQSAFDFTFFFGDEDIGIDNVWAINANAHYNFISQGVNVYALSGINFTNISVGTQSFRISSNPRNSNNSTSLGSTSDSEIGFNVGAGVEFSTGMGDIYLEPKYIIGNFDQFVISSGLRIGI